MNIKNKGFAPVFIIIIILGVLAIGGGAYFLTKDSDSISKDASKNGSYFSGKVSDMFKKGEPLECSTEMGNVEGSMKAVYYFDNNNEMVRVEMQSVDKSTGTAINTVSIIKDDWNYFWDDLMNKDGMKIKLDESKVEATGKETEKENVSIDMNKKFDFTCKSWKVDSTKFDLPKDKAFKDLSDMMNNFSNFTAPQAGSVNGTQNYCDVCKMIPDAAEKNECLSSC